MAKEFSVAPSWFQEVTITIDPEFKALIPPLAPEEREQLEKSIIAEGCRDALVTWNGLLVDGHNRYKICKEHGIEYRIVEMEFADRDAVKLWMIQNQAGRRNLTAFARSELALKAKELIAAKAKERQLAAQNNNAGRAVSQKSAKQDKPIDTRAELATIAEVSHDTIAKAERILTEGTPEQIDRARKGGTGNSINAISKEIKQKEQAAAPKSQEQVAAPVGIDAAIKAYESSFDTFLRDLDKIAAQYGDTIKHTDGGKKQVSDLFGQKIDKILAHLRSL